MNPHLGCFRSLDGKEFIRKRPRWKLHPIDDSVVHCVPLVAPVRDLHHPKSRISPLEGSSHTFGFPIMPGAEPSKDSLKKFHIRPPPPRYHFDLPIARPGRWTPGQVNSPEQKACNTAERGPTTVRGHSHTGASQRRPSGREPCPRTQRACPWVFHIYEMIRARSRVTDGHAKHDPTLHLRFRCFECAVGLRWEALRGEAGRDQASDVVRAVAGGTRLPQGEDQDAFPVSARV